MRLCRGSGMGVFGLCRRILYILRFASPSLHFLLNCFRFCDILGMMKWAEQRNCRQCNRWKATGIFSLRCSSARFLPPPETGEDEGRPHRFVCAAEAMDRPVCLERMKAGMNDNALLWKIGKVKNDEMLALYDLKNQGFKPVEETDREERKMENTAKTSEQMQTAAPKAKPEGKKASPVWIVVCLAVLGTALIVIGVNVMLSLTDYRPARGLLNSEWIGLKWYERLVNTPQFTSYFVNSVVLRAAQLIAGLILSLPLVLWVKCSKKPGAALTKACLCLVPMCVPFLITGQAVISFLPREFYLESQLYPLCFAAATVIQTCGFFAFCGGLFQYLSRRGIGGGAGQGLLVAFLISMVSSLSPDRSANLMLSNAMNRSASSTLDFSIFQLGLSNMQFGMSAATSVLKMAAEALIAVLPLVLLARIAKKDESRIALPDAQGSGLVFTTAQLIWLGLLAALLVATMGISTLVSQPDEAVQAIGAVIQDGSVINAALVSALVALTSGLLGGFIAYALIAQFRASRGGMGLAMLLVFAFSSCLISEYLSIRTLGVLNSMYSAVLHNLFDYRLLSLAFVFVIVLRMAPERSTRGLVLGLMLLGAAFAWGDFYGPYIFISRGSAPLSMMLFRLVFQGSASGDAAAMTEAQRLVEAARVPVMTLLTGLPALLFGFGGAALCIRAFKDAK